MHFIKKTKIKTQVEVLLFNKVFTLVLAKYSNDNNVFSIKNIAKLPEHIGINDYIIKLKKIDSHFSNIFIA